MYITPEVEMERERLEELFKAQVPDKSLDKDIEDRIAKLNEIKKEREFRRTIAISNNEDIKSITSSIEENMTAIKKLEVANDILRGSRSVFIKEVGEKFDEENPSDDVELMRLISQQSQYRRRPAQIADFDQFKYFKRGRL